MSAELVVVAERHGRELRFDFRLKYRYAVPTEIGSGHRHDVGRGIEDRILHKVAKPAGLHVSTVMVELIDTDETAVEGTGITKLLVSKAKCRMRTDEYGRTGVLEELTEFCDLSLVGTGCTEVVFRRRFPVGKEACRSEVRCLEG